jgi:hypothetical protein
MSERPTSAAASLYPHLPSVDRAPVQGERPRLADAMYPALAPKSPPPLNWWQAAGAAARQASGEANARTWWGRR